MARKVEVRVFQSHEEAELADLAYYRSLTPEERMAILFELRRQAHGDEQPMERVVSIRRLVQPDPTTP